MQFEPIDFLLILVAAAVIWRLFSVLGTRADTTFDLEQKDAWKAKSTSEPALENESREALRQADQGKPIEGNVSSKMKRNFSEAEFLAGAKIAYEIVVEAFAIGDLDMLRPLISKDVYEQFEAAINDRSNNPQTIVTRLIQMRSQKIEDIQTFGNRMKIKVQFVADFVSLKSLEPASAMNEESNIIQIIDSWEFERDINSEDPNWQITSTNSD